jgi:type IV pilus assembly protein PilW
MANGNPASIFGDEQRARRCRGFGMVELMVAIVISMVVILVIAQTYALFEAQKRTTTSGADAQNNGLTALHFLETDIHTAGYGMATSTTTPAGLACSTVNYYNSALATPAQFNQLIMPVQIIDGGAGPNSSDTIVVTASNSPAGAVPAGLITSAATSSAVLTVQAPVANIFNVGDLIMVAVPGSGTPCARLQVAAITAFPGGVQITAGSTGAPNLSPPAATNLFPAGGFSNSPQAYVFDMGSMVSNQYQVNCSSLTLVNLVNGATPNPPCTSQSLFAATVTPIASNIVNIQAQYGVAVAGNQSVTCWVNAIKGAGAGCPGIGGAADWSNPNTANIGQIKAIRVAVVARSDQMERAAVTFQCTNTSGNVNNGPCAWPDTAASPAPVIDLSADPNWQRYRYKVFQTIIPLRNILWANL